MIIFVDSFAFCWKWNIYATLCVALVTVVSLLLKLLLLRWEICLASFIMKFPGIVNT